MKDFPKDEFENLRKLYEDFSIDTAIRVKEIESVTNHDVKAVEYLIKEEFDKLGLSDFKEFIHFELTSQDINNTVVPFQLKSVQQYIFPELKKVTEKLNELSNEWKNVPMLARTHGQHHQQN